MQREYTGSEPRFLPDDPIRPSTGRRNLASYPTYDEAQRAVDYLADQKFPVEHVAIVAEGIRVVEQVTGRRGYAQAALRGAITTGLAGAFFGYLLGLFSLAAPFVSGVILAFYGLVFGAVVGAILGLLFHALSGGQRDFSSVTGIQADHYLLQVDAAVADEAGKVLAGLVPVRSNRSTGADSHTGDRVVD